MFGFSLGICHDLPRTLSIVNQGGAVAMLTFLNNAQIVFPPIPSLDVASFQHMLGKGVTPKQIVKDLDENFYMVKSPEHLPVKEVFKDYIPDPELENDDEAKRQHIFDVQLEMAFLEVFYSKVCKKLFSEFLVVPELLLHVDSGHEIYVFSKLLEHFYEFLSHKPCVAEALLYNRAVIPGREALELSMEEAHILGQLYAVSLVINHWDILNANLLNSGLSRVEDRTLPAIVDFGLCGHLSYQGRHNDSLPFKDKLFSLGRTIELNNSSDHYLRYYRAEHALPFDKKVGPLQPHRILNDLFDLSIQNPIALEMRKGFEFLIDHARQALMASPTILQEALTETLASVSNESAISRTAMLERFNQNFYTYQPNSFNIFSIIKARVYDCVRLLEEFRSGQSMTSIHENVRDLYVIAQKPR